jgi:hypothetical protein
MSQILEKLRHIDGGVDEAAEPRDDWGLSKMFSRGESITGGAITESYTTGGWW